MHTSLQPLGECHCCWTRDSPRAHVTKFYVRLQLIRSVLRASKFSVLKFIEIVIFGVYTLSLLASVCFGTFVIWWSLFNFFNYFVWLRIIDDGSVLEMRIWSILLSIFSYCKSQQGLYTQYLVMFLQNIWPKHIFRFSRGGGSTLIYLQVCTFTL